MNKKVLLIGLSMVAMLVFVLAAGFGVDPHSIRSPLIGRPAPGFRLVDLEGNAVELAALEGQPVVVNFWATWCGPCQAEHPVLLAAAQRYGDVNFLGIVYEDERPNILAYLQRHGSGYPTLEDLGGQVAIAYGVGGIPETFFIDTAGTVIHKHTGPIGWPQMVSGLEMIR